MAKILKEISELKQDIYEISMKNIKSAQDLYSQLIPENAGADIVAVNSEFAVECLRSINDSTAGLIKFYAEIAKVEGGNKTEFNSNDFYKAIEKLATDPTRERKDASSFTPLDTDKNILKDFKKSDDK
jgi:hypothetical protein